MKRRQWLTAGLASGSGSSTVAGSTSTAVLVLIHGESYSWGAGHLLDGGLLAAKSRMIVVTLNYRLGILGIIIIIIFHYRWPSLTIVVHRDCSSYLLFDDDLTIDIFSLAWPPIPTSMASSTIRQLSHTHTHSRTRRLDTEITHRDTDRILDLVSSYSHVPTVVIKSFLLDTTQLLFFILSSLPLSLSLWVGVCV